MARQKRTKPSDKPSAVNLWIMGLLMDHPMSAYDIARLVRSDVIGILLKVSAPAVYKNVRDLQAAGYLQMGRSRTGEMPEKKVYTVTDKGKAYFLMLMDWFSRNLPLFYFEFDTFLANIDKVEKDAGIRMLGNLKDRFYEMKKWIVDHEQEARARKVPFAGRVIIKQYRMIVYTLIAWIEEVIEEYRGLDHIEGHYTMGQHHAVGPRPQDIASWTK